MSKRGFRGYAWGLLVYNLGVVLWGAYVRASSSGAGCGAHWPLCNGEVVPHSPSVARLIEFTHRVSSGVDVVLILGLLAWALAAWPRRDPVRRAAWLAMVFIITEALLGAMLVLFQYVNQNTSGASVLVQSLHMANTLLLLAALTLTGAWTRWGRRRPAAREWLGGAGIAATAILGAIAALGDTVFPAASLAAGMRQDFSSATSLLLRVRVFHPLLAVVTGGYLIWLALRRAAPAAPWLVGAVLVQWTAGLLDWTLLAPIPLQIIHLLGADLVWIAFVVYAGTHPATTDAKPE